MLPRSIRYPVTSKPVKYTSNQHEISIPPLQVGQDRNVPFPHFNQAVNKTTPAHIFNHPPFSEIPNPSQNELQNNGEVKCGGCKGCIYATRQSDFHTKGNMADAWWWRRITIISSPFAYSCPLPLAGTVFEKRLNAYSAFHMAYRSCSSYLFTFCMLEC